jgi:hypothetical protein
LKRANFDPEIIFSYGQQVGITRAIAKARALSDSAQIKTRFGKMRPWEIKAIRDAISALAVDLSNDIKILEAERAKMLSKRP